MSEVVREGPGLGWRRLADDERDLLEALLARDFAGSRDLLAQVEVAEAQRGCECGCGTINLRVNESLAPRARLTGSLTGEAEVLSETGESVGGLLLFARRGYLSCMEIYTFDGDPASLPIPDRIRLDPIGGGMPGTDT